MFRVDKGAVRRAGRAFWWLVLVWTTLLLGGGGLWLASVVINDRPWELPFVVLAVGVWVAGVVRYWLVKPGLPEDCLVLEEPTHSAVARLLDGLDEDLGVQLPDRYAVMPEPGVAVCLDRVGQVTLVIGGQSLCFFDERSLREELRAGVAMAGLYRLPVVRRLEGRRMRLGALVDGTLHGLVDKTLARFFVAFGRMREFLWDEVEAAHPHLFSEDRKQQRAELVEAWEHFAAGFLQPAHHVFKRPTRALDGFARFLAALAEHGVLTPAAVDPLRPVITTLQHGADIDLALTALAYRDVDDAWVGVAWEDYPNDVMSPLLRDESAQLLHAIGLVRGAAVPASVSAVWSALQDGSWLTTGSVLGAPDADSAESLTQSHLASLVGLALLESARADLMLDWLRGSIIVDADGDEVPVSRAVADAWSERSPLPVLALLDRCEVSADAPVFVAGTETGSGSPYAVPVLQPVFQHGYPATLAIYGDEVVLLRTNPLFSWAPKPLRFLRRIIIDWRLWRHTEWPMSQLEDCDAVRVRIPVNSIVGAHLKPSHWGWYAWKCRLRTADRTWTLNGSQPLGLAAANLEALLGDRLSTRGIQPDPATGAWASRDLGPMRRMWKRALLMVAGLTAPIALLLSLASIGEQSSAEVISCSVDPSDQRYLCNVRDPATGQSSDIPMRPQEPGSTVSVINSDGPTGWEPQATSRLTSDFAFFLVFTAILVGLAWLLARWRVPVKFFGGHAPATGPDEPVPAR